jgi:hypothetical protein
MLSRQKVVVLVTLIAPATRDFSLAWAEVTSSPSRPTVKFMPYVFRDWRAPRCEMNFILPWLTNHCRWKYLKGDNETIFSPARVADLVGRV